MKITILSILAILVIGCSSVSYVPEEISEEEYERSIAALVADEAEKRRVAIAQFCVGVFYVTAEELHNQGDLQGANAYASAAMMFIETLENTEENIAAATLSFENAKSYLNSGDPEKVQAFNYALEACIQEHIAAFN